MNNDNLKPYKKGESGNPKGRPPKLESVLKKHFLAEHGLRLSRGQVSQLIESILPMSIKEIKKMSDDDNLPFFISIIAKKAIKDYKAGDMELVNMLLDRVHGKPKQQNEIAGIDGEEIKIKIDFHNATIEDLRKLSNLNQEDDN